MKSNSVSKTVNLISLGFREKMAVTLTFVITFVMLISVYLVTIQVKNTSMKRAMETGRMLGRMIALSMGEDIVRGNFRGVDYALKEFVTINKIKYCMILNNLGKVLSSADTNKNGKYFADGWSRSAVYSTQLSIRRAAINNIPIYDTTIPIIIGGNRYGLIRIGFTLEDEYKSIRKILLYNLTLGCILIVFGLLIAYGVSVTVLAPLNTVLIAVETLSKGDYSQKSFADGSPEFANLANSFNQLSLILNNQDSPSNFASRKRWQDYSEIDLTHFSGKLVDAAILYISISDFNSFIDRHSPSEAVDTINSFYNNACEVIKQSGGIVDKIHDGKIFAVFPMSDESQWPADLKAVYAALLVRSSMDIFNFNQSKLGLEELNISSAIAFGQIVVGQIGPNGKQDFSCVGRTVDRAIEMAEISKVTNNFAAIVDRKVASLSGSFLSLSPIRVHSDNTSEAVEYFVVKGFSNLLYFKERLDTSDEVDTRRFIKLFGLTADADGIEILQNIIDDTSSKYRYDALVALKSFVCNEDNVASNYLQKIIADENSEQNLRAGSVMMLGWKRDVKLVPFFTKLLQDENDRVRANALEACISLRFPDKKDLFQSMLKDSSSRVCANALLGLWMSDDHETLSHIYSLLKADDYKMRASAAYAINFLATARKFRRLFPAYKEQKKFLLLPVIENILKRLKMILGSDEPTERIQALKAIGKIGGISMKKDVQELIDVETSPEIIEEAQNILNKWTQK